MVSNYDRIYDEICSEAERLAPGNGLEVDSLVALVMEIVDLEDRHRIKSIRINQLVEEKIETAARGGGA